MDETERELNELISALEDPGGGEEKTLFRITKGEAAQAARQALERMTDEERASLLQAVAKGASLIQEITSGLIDSLSKAVQGLQTSEIMASVGQVLSLAAALEEALKAEQAEGRYLDTTTEDILLLQPWEMIDESGAIKEGPYKALLEKALQETEKPPTVTATRTDELENPVDKLNSVVWDLLTEADKDGQITLAINTSKSGKARDVLVLYSINFDELENVKITKSLTPFDKRVYVAVAALYNAGNEYITPTQIYKMMGYKGQPGPSDIVRINDSLTKMGAARVYIDNEKESEKYPRYMHFTYDAALLPFERKSAYINGQLAECAIHPFREPPMLSFARQRNQITTIPRALLEAPISKTEANLRLEDYLLERIARMKNSKGSASKKMLYSTIFERCRIATKKEQQRAPAKIRTYLEHYRATGWIAGYKAESDAVTVIL